MTAAQTRVLVIDVGGTHVKILATGLRTPLKIDSGPAMTARRMVASVRKAASGWNYSRVSIGFPGPVAHGKPLAEPHNLGAGWVGFDFRKAFGHPVKMVNDAAMQAIGSYEGRRMLFLGLGTGLGSAFIVDGLLESMELAHLPYKNGRTYEDYGHRRRGAPPGRARARLRGNRRRQCRTAQETPGARPAGRQPQRLSWRLQALGKTEGGKAPVDYVKPLVLAACLWLAHSPASAKRRD
jgi:polyphosphate glucokinase